MRGKLFKGSSMGDLPNPANMQTVASTIMQDESHCSGCIGTALAARASPHAHIKLLVEVTIKDTAVPAHIDCVAAHHAVCCCHVEAFHQHLCIHTGVRKPLFEAQLCDSWPLDLTVCPS